MPVRMQQVVLCVAVLGGVLGLVALSRSMTSSGSLLLAPVVLFPYVILALTSRAAHATPPQSVLLTAGLLFVVSSSLTLTPSSDAQGGLIVVAVPMLQGGLVVAIYVLLRVFGALSPRVTASRNAS